MSRNAPQLPNNAATPNNISVVSSAGFAAGELVYFNGGDYGTISNTAFSTDVFNITTTTPASYFVNSGGYASTANSGGGTNGVYAQKLSNGNFVNVYILNATGQPAFKIVDSTGTVVVAETLIASSSPYTTYTGGNISVAALSGGGFAVAFINSNGYLSYAVFSNTGSSVLTITQDSFDSFTNSATIPTVLALPNGGFVIALSKTGSNVQYRIFAAGGTSVYSWTSAGLASYNTPAGTRLAARSDSSFIIMATNGGSSLSYAIFSATNTVVLSATSFSTNGGSRVFDVTCLADGTTFVLAYGNYDSTASSYSVSYRFLPTGNVLGSEFGPIGQFGYSSGGGSYSINLLGLADGTFMIAWSSTSGFIQYAFFSAAGACISGTATGVVVPRTLPGSLVWINSYINLVENTSKVDLYFSNTSYNEIPYNQQSCSVSKTTFNAIPVGSSTTVTLGSQTLAVSGYAKNGSSPTKACFLATTSSNPALSSSIGYVVSPTVVASTNSLGSNSAVLANGNFVVVYASASTGAVTAKIYAPNGALVSTISVGTLYSTSYYNAVKVAGLTGGRFVIVYNTANTSTLTHQIYSSGGSLLYTYTMNYSGYSFYIGNDNNFSICAIGNDRYVLVGTYNYWFVYDNTATLVYGPGAQRSGAISGASCAPTADGGFIYGGYYTSYGIGYNDVVSPSGASSYANKFQGPTSSTSPIYGGCSTYAGVQGNLHVVLSNQGAATLQPVAFSAASSTIYAQNTSVYTNSNGAAGVGTTAIGNIAFIYAVSGGASVNMISDPASMWGSGIGYPTGFLTTLTGVVPSSGGSGAASFTVNAIGSGSQVLFTWNDNNNYPNFAIINTFPISGSTTITAGVTPSAGIPLSVANGYVFTGVSSSAASAGGVGQVQTNGSAQLNSSYSASLAYQAFDFQNPGVLGVRGTIVGRNVNLQGNN